MASQVTLRVSKRTAYRIETSDDDGFNVQFEPMNVADVVIRHIENGLTVVGYLAHDTDCENPFDSSDAVGCIYDRRPRNATSESVNAFCEALGTDRCGTQIRKANPHAVLLDVYRHSGEVWRVNNSGVRFPDEQWDVSHHAGVWVPTPACLEHIKSEAVLRLIPGANIKYVGNSITWTLADGRSKGGYKTWMNAVHAVRKAAGAKLDKQEITASERKIAVECATQAIETYNEWLSGACYGVCVEVFNPIEDDPIEDEACWGFIGNDYAVGELQHSVDTVANRLISESKKRGNYVPS